MGVAKSALCSARPSRCGAGTSARPLYVTAGMPRADVADSGTRPACMDARYIRARPADHREPNVKQGGVWRNGVKIPVFMVVICTTDAGDGYKTADFVAPAGEQVGTEHAHVDRVAAGASG